MNILEEIQNCPVEWKELGEISHFYGGLAGKTKSDFENGNAKYVTYKNIFNNLQVELNLLETVRVYENEKQNSNNRIFRKQRGSWYVISSYFYS